MFTSSFGYCLDDRAQDTPISSDPYLLSTDYTTCMDTNVYSGDDCLLRKKNLHLESGFRDYTNAPLCST